MHGEDGRSCDLCGEGIAVGERYRVARLPPEIAAIFLDTDDRDLMPTLTQEPDGNVRLDICLICHLSMGAVATTEDVT